MENTPGEFIEWALHPDRTLEERYGIEVLLEKTEPHLRKKEGLPHVFNFEADRLRHKARSLDPGHRPAYRRTQIERVAPVLPELSRFDFRGYEDRPLRDISFLRFCPGITSLNISSSEITDWSPISHLPQLSDLWITDDEVRDLTPVGTVPSLKTLYLRLGTPWPDMGALARLPQLTKLSFWGNILALGSIPLLPSLTHAAIQHGSNFKVPLRDLHGLPEMPSLRSLELINTDQLTGIERYPLLLNLAIYGYYRDLSPLASLGELTHLFLSGSRFTDITPVSHLPSLCRISIRADLPPDLTPLADCSRLHEIVMKETPVIPAELASLNALAPSWENEFAAAQKRPLKPLRLLVRKPFVPGVKRAPEAIPGLLERDWGDNLEMGKSESRWFVRKVNRRLTKLLGKTWKPIDYSALALSPGNLHIEISRSEHIDRLPAIVTLLRKCCATARHRWTYLLIIDSLAEYERDMDQIAETDPDEFDAESERQEWEYYRKRKQEREDFLRRKYLHQLRQETGTPPPPASPGETPPGTETTAPQRNDSEEPEFDLGTRLHLYVTLTETSALIAKTSLELAEMLFETKAEPGEWFDPEED